MELYQKLEKNNRGKKIFLTMMPNFFIGLPQNHGSRHVDVVSHESGKLACNRKYHGACPMEFH